MFKEIKKMFGIVDTQIVVLSAKDIEHTKSFSYSYDTYMALLVARKAMESNVEQDCLNDKKYFAY